MFHNKRTVSLAVQKLGDLYFDGLVQKYDLKPTIGQFLKFVENHKDLSDEDKKVLAFNQLQSFAKEAIKPMVKHKWPSLKKYLFDQFRCQLTLLEKIELRRYLHQEETESAQEFHDRCIKGQFMLCDDREDLVFERDILINFISGLREDIYNRVIQLDNISSSLQMCLKKVIEIEEKEAGINDIISNEVKYEEIKVEAKYETNDPLINENEYDISNGFLYDHNIDETYNDSKIIEIKQEKIESPRENIEDINDEEMLNSDDNDGDSDFEPTTEELNQLKRSNTKTVSKEYPCSFCSKTLSSERLLSKHLLLKHDQKDHYSKKLKRCDLCDGKIVKSFYEHFRYVHPEQFKIKYANYSACEFCTKKKQITMKPVHLAMHKQLKHPQIDPNNPKNKLCQICGKSFNKKDPLRRHVVSEHFNQKLPKCDVCQRLFSEESKLRKHWKEGICKRDPIPCDFCGKTFLNKSKLKWHRNKQHGLGWKKEDSKVICPICAKMIQSNAHLKSHMDGVHGDKNIYCDQCGRAFTSEQRMLSHRNTHLEKTIKCTVEGCKSMFSANSLLKSHIRSCHNERVVLKRKERNHKCNECSMAFHMPAQLKSHKAAVHGGEKPFKCQHCDYEAAYRARMNHHINSVHKNVMFECIVPGCGKQMNEKGNMDKHMKTAHGIPLPSERKPEKKKIFIDEKNK